MLGIDYVKRFSQKPTGEYCYVKQIILGLGWYHINISWVSNQILFKRS